MNNIVPNNQESPQSDCSLRGNTRPLHLLNKRQKPQISGIPGVSVTERQRYRVMIGDHLIASHLDLDSALEIAANSTAVTEVDS
jgi:hypothetical protein